MYIYTYYICIYMYMCVCIYIYSCIIESLCCTPETNPTL